MGVVKEFKEFILRGNVVDLAIGVIIGGAFNKIVESLVGDIIMPLIGTLIGTPDFSSIKIGESIMIGTFINAVVNFIIVGTVLFFLIRAAGKKGEDVK